ncbi:hypothetical protein HK104_004513 [Borealophlyctis nickersoniae]|nr:hypothetical protein HK104_004513 [Borealophlyctis nickersoniae]
MRTTIKALATLLVVFAGCGAGCAHACPFGFPCVTNADCLSKSCTAGYCDVGAPVKFGSPSPAKPPTSDTPSENAWSMPDFKDGLNDLNIVHDSYGQDLRKVVPDPAGTGLQVLQIMYPAGSYNPSGSPRGGSGFYAAPIDLSKAKSVAFEFQMYFPAGFDFVKGGKLPGLYGGRTGCSGGDPATDCFSTRFMFRSAGVAEIYLYVEDALQVDAFCKVPPVSVCNPQYGNSIGRGAWSWQTGKWQKVMQRITLNTPGKPDGRVQVFFNGQSVLDFSQVVWRATPNIGFVGIEFETFFGGADSSWATPKDQYIYFKGLSITWQ